MSQNGMDDEAIVALYKSMVLNPNLEVLNLSDNHGGHYHGAKAAARALRACKKLRVLKCNDHTFGERGGLELAQGLKDGCPLLEILDGMNNDFTPKVATAMAGALGGKAHLRWACLHFNNFGEKGNETLGQALGDRMPPLGAVPPGTDPDAEYEDYYDSEEEDEEANDGDEIEFTDMPEEKYFAEFARCDVPVHAAAAAAAATTRAGGLHTSIEMFENMGISTPAEIAQLNKVLTHLRLLATENGSWQKTSEDDVVKAWRTLGNRLLLSRGNASYPALAQVVRGFASDAALQQRGLFNQSPYTTGSEADSVRQEILASLV